MKNLLRYGFMLFSLACIPILTKAQCTLSAGSAVDKCVFQTDSIQLHGAATGGFTAYSWTTSGSGTVYNSTALNAYYKYSQADITNNSVTLTLTASGGTCGTVTSQVAVTIYKQPKVVIADNEFTVCGSTIPVTTTATGASALQWYTQVGSGTFSTTTATNTVYTPSAADITRGFVLIEIKGTTPISGCFHMDTVRVNIASSVSLNAGTDQTVCAAPTNTMIYSNATGAYTTYAWTTSGTGTFSDPTQLASPYTVSAADIAAGNVTLTLTGSSTACGSASDARTLTILARPTVSAGIDQTVCTDTAVLNGTVTPSSGATLQWSNVTGTGTITGSTILTTSYRISADDVTRGYALVRLKATSSAGCTQEDTVKLNILTAPIVFAGSNQISCSGSVQLTGYVINETAKTWATSGTGTFANASKDSTIYTPSTTDRNSGEVTLTYTGVNTCSTVSNTSKIKFLVSAQPVISAGADESVCGKDTVQLLGSVVNASGGNWSANGTGRFIFSKSHLANLYILSAADKSAGTISFTLSSYSNGGCNSVSDVKTVTIQSGSLPHVNAGLDQTSSVTTQLNATVSDATSQLWQTSGVGVFTPNPTLVNASYIPSADDIAAGSVTLTLVATNSCGTASDALTVFTAAPSSISGTVSAGANTLDRGVVYLYDVVGFAPRVIAIDTIKQVDNGVYEFSSVPNGNYVIYAVPESVSISSTSYLATYAGSVPATNWLNAGDKHISNSSANVIDIALVAYTSALPNWNAGNDTISGAVFFDSTPPTPVMHRLAGTNFAPLAGVVVYLKNLNGQVIAYTSTDKYGTYSFNNVVEGNYYVYSECSNTMDLSGGRVIAVDGNPLTIEDGNTVVKVWALIMNVFSQNKSIQINVYPNPASDNIHLQLPKSGNYVITISDETGVVHIEQQMNVRLNEAADVSIAGLSKGLYIIQITSGEEVYNTKVIKF
ncbi:T9SS type A sorting domain-containing protein [Cytophaga aurantiaca]|uniref:T9SS type A sorting domain-containing protein n=1 Tax=Cytophaga aurantiaca TaxID=29530 RepID=UPI00035FCB98|nr:T9SS type A sorting domain-containing protein [Cytophaga aurantiaca]